MEIDTNPIKPITIVGCGPGSPDLITPAARQAAEKADVLVGFPRLLELFPIAGHQRIVGDANIERLLDQIAVLLEADRRIVVLVSGDPGVYSLAKNIIGRFGRDQCRTIPAVSSVQVAFARLGLEWTDARILSAHGRTPQETPRELQSNAKVAILAGSQDAMTWAAEAARQLRATHVAFVCKNLTMPDERVEQMTPEDLAACRASSLSIVILVRRELLE